MFAVYNGSGDPRLHRLALLSLLLVRWKVCNKSNFSPFFITEPHTFIFSGMQLRYPRTRPDELPYTGIRKRCSFHIHRSVILFLRLVANPTVFIFFSLSFGGNKSLYIIKDHKGILAPNYALDDENVDFALRGSAYRYH